MKGIKGYGFFIVLALIEKLKCDIIFVRVTS